MTTQFYARHGTPSHLRNLDPQVWAAEAIAAARAQTVPHAVAPRCTVPSKRGVLGAGEAITVDDIEPTKGQDGHLVPAWKRFADLVEHGLVLERI